MSLLRKPTTPPKPRITKLPGGGWLCEGCNLGGTGRTPEGAYRAWFSHMVMKGAEVMRRLRPFA